MFALQFAANLNRKYLNFFSPVIQMFDSLDHFSPGGPSADKLTATTDRNNTDRAAVLLFLSLKGKYIKQLNYRPSKAG